MSKHWSTLQAATPFLVPPKIFYTQLPIAYSPVPGIVYFMDHRRDFLKAGAALAAGALLRGQASNAIKVGLVGCGGRGTGAAAQALRADDFAELTAVADPFQERIDQCLAELNKSLAAKVKVDPAHQFKGLDGYQKLIESGVDVVLLATPPGFRPAHLRACVEARNRVFCHQPLP